MTHTDSSDGQAIMGLLRLLVRQERTLVTKGKNPIFDLYETYVGRSPNYLDFESGSHAFDWTVPDAWVVNQATLCDPSGNVISDYRRSALEVVGYSRSFKGKVSLEDLRPHLYSIPEHPDWIPYVTSYYKDSWGFCMTHNKLKELSDGMYDVHIDSELISSNLQVLEDVFWGESDKEIVFWTYTCHPEMMNNESSGPAFLIELGKYLSSLKRRKYTYRLIAGPETIGSICYLSKRLKYLKENVICGFVLSCLGDKRDWSLVSSPNSDNLADRAIWSLIKDKVGAQKYSFKERGSDERQFCAPLVGLPFATISRSKFNTYPEYHSSADDLSLASVDALDETFRSLKLLIQCFENDPIPKPKIHCEPMMSKRFLYREPTNRAPLERDDVKLMMDILAYSDGQKSIFDLAIELEASLSDVDKCVQILRHNELVG